MSLDLVEKLMAHQGYLTQSYVRIPDEEARKQFHAGESALYITRRDQRSTSTEIDILRSERDELLKMKPQMEELLALGPMIAEYMKERERRNG
jgi:hypothetical protein